MRTREDLRSWGSSRDESQATSHDSVIVFGFRVCELGRSPLPVGKSLQITTFPPPRFPQSIYAPGGAGSGVERIFILRAQVTGSPVLGVASCPSFPGSPDRPPRVLASSFPWCVPREGEATLGSRTPGR